MQGRKINIFEKLLLPVGMSLTFFGFYLILQADEIDNMVSWLKLATVFIWLILLFIVLLSAITEDMKEELALIQREHVTEIKLLREIVHDQLQEVKMLRKDIED